MEIKVHLGRKLTVPEGAIIDTGIRQLAIIDKGSGYFEPREVKVGAKVDNYYEVIKGLKAGERVVTSANFLIDSESKLKEAVGGMAVCRDGTCRTWEIIEFRISECGLRNFKLQVNFRYEHRTDYSEFM